MAGLTSWLSPNVTHALAWALIHSLWQCLGLAAAAAVLMAVSSRPSVRYSLGVYALAAMLAMPVATLFVLLSAPARAPSSQNHVVVPHSVAPSRLLVGSGAKNAPEVSPVVRVLEENQPASLNILPWLVADWLCGVTFFSLRFAGGFVLLEYRRRRKTGTLDPHILSLCHALQQQLGLSRAIGYLQCNWLEAPAVIGWLRPVVLLPIAALTGLTEGQLRAVIAHELAHVRRFDAFVNLFQVLVETLLFYHPAVWWLNKRIRAERELCCDEIAIAASGSRLEYAQALTLMAEWDAAPRFAMAANRGPLSERILHILGRKPAGTGQRMIGLTGGVLFLVAAVAAANALFTIAAPPIAQARESVKAALSAGQTPVAHLAQQVFSASEPAPTNLGQEERTASTVSKADQHEALKDAQDQKLVSPAADLSMLPAINALTKPTVLAFNSSSSTAQKDQSATLASPEASATSLVTTSAVSSDAMPKAVAMANMPTGADDPNAVVCRAPQPIAGSGQLGPQVCLHNNEWWKVAMNGKDISPDGNTLIDRPTVKDPTGEGDPDAITCRAPRILDNGATIARYSPVFCRPNSFWADLIKNDQIVDLNGNILRRLNKPPMPMPGFTFQSRLNANSGEQHYGPASGTP